MRDIVAGDTYTTTQHIAGCSSTEYTSKLFLSGPSTVNTTGVARDDGGWDFTFTSNQTAILEKGEYSYAIRVYKSGETFTKEIGSLRVLPDPASTVTERQFAERMIEAIEKCLEGQLSTEEAVAVNSFSVGGRSLTFLSREELLNERATWIRKLNKLRGSGSGIKTIPININSILGMRR